MHCIDIVCWLIILLRQQALLLLVADAMVGDAESESTMPEVRCRKMHTAQINFGWGFMHLGDILECLSMLEHTRHRTLYWCRIQARAASISRYEKDESSAERTVQSKF